MPRVRAPFHGLLLLAGLSSGPAVPAATVPSGFVEEQLTPLPGIANQVLSEPRAMALLPDGRVLIAEQRTARVRLWNGPGLEEAVTIATLDNVNPNGYERGLQGIAVDPQWPARPYVYVFHNAFDATLKLRRFTASGALTDPGSHALTLGSPLTLIGDIPDDDANHNAGALDFGPDGMLYVGLGEDERVCTATDSSSLRGALLRVRVDLLPTGGGGVVPRALLIPPDNPLATPDSNAMLVFAYGFRNPWQVEVDPLSGLPYVSDVGEADEEELDEVEAGGHYGWPWREGASTVLSRSACPEPGGPGNPANGFRAPVVAYARDAGLHSMTSSGVYRAVSGAAANWPQDHRGTLLWGNYFVGDLRRVERDFATGQWLPAPDVPGQPLPGVWGTGFRAAVDFEVGADGALYWLQQFASGSFTGVNGTLRRVRWSGVTTDAPPLVSSGLRLAVSPNPATGPTVVRFSMPRAGAVRLVMHDLAGREVITLRTGHAPAGESAMLWDGRDADGREVEPGVYLVQLEAAGIRQSARVLCVR